MSYPRRPKKPKAPIPTEADEQKAVAKHLDALGVLWCHVPNGSLAAGSSRGRFAKLARLLATGLKPGVPDIVIFDPPPALRGFKGSTIEMKRKKGGVVSPEQERWYCELSARGWATAICEGADAAFLQIKAWGYSK